MYQNFVGFCLTHREKPRFYEFEPWLIGFNSITADICCEKARKIVLFEISEEVIRSNAMAIGRMRQSFGFGNPDTRLR
jgi:hypothetical protein